jgi:hypothetical protein
MTGRVSELKEMYEWIARHQSEVKLVIAGNHDQTLDREFYAHGENWRLRHRGAPENMDAARKIWDEGNEGSVKGSTGRVLYLEEGIRRVELSRGRSFTVSRLSIVYDTEVLVFRSV